MRVPEGEAATFAAPSLGSDTVQATAVWPPNADATREKWQEHQI
jgi:hypothetical protein